MKKKFINESAITLIALIITVVLLILVAGISISQISGDGLVSRTLSAREHAEIQGEKETIQAAVVQAKARNRYGKLTKDELQEELGETDYTVSEEDDLYIITLAKTKRSYLLDKSGNVTQRGKWFADYTTGRIAINGEEVKSGDVYLEIGDTIAGYDPTDGATYNEVTSYGESTTAHPSTNGYADTVFRLQPVQGDNEKQTVSYDLSKGWKLLGVTTEGNLMITTADVVYPVSGGYLESGVLKITLCGRTGYKYATEELDNISKLYGQGNLAISSRSIKVEDINKLTGYNPEDIDGYGTKYQEGTLQEYGKKIICFWEEDDVNYPYYSYKNGDENTKIKFTANHHYDGLYYYDYNVNDWINVMYSNLRNKVSLENTEYNYNGSSFNLSSKIKNIIFLNNQYWLASKCLNVKENYVYYYIVNINYTNGTWTISAAS